MEFPPAFTPSPSWICFESYSRRIDIHPNKLGDFHSKKKTDSHLPAQWLAQKGSELIKYEARLHVGRVAPVLVCSSSWSWSYFRELQWSWFSCSKMSEKFAWVASAMPHSDKTIVLSQEVNLSTSRLYSWGAYVIMQECVSHQTEAVSIAPGCNRNCFLRCVRSCLLQPCQTSCHKWWFLIQRRTNESKEIGRQHCHSLLSLKGT